MPTAQLDGAEIYYEVVGEAGPWVAAISGGRHPLAEIDELTRAIASRGYRVVVHDRRNCGRSSLEFGTAKSEEELWADDLRALLDLLRATPTIVVGKSRGARLGIRFALRHRRATRALLLWGLSGGAAAARYLEDYYYGQYLRACEEGGMAAVCAIDHFAGLVAARPSNRQFLLEMDPHRFLSAMRRWRDQFLVGVNHPVMGLSDGELRTVAVPTAIVPKYNRLHPHATVTHAHEMIPGSRFFDFDPTRHDARAVSPAEEKRDTVIMARILAEFTSSLVDGGSSGHGGGGRAIPASGSC